MRRYLGKALFTPLAMFLCVTVGACSADPVEVSSSNALDTRLEWAQDQATSQFERDALEDGEVTRAEYEEAVSRFVVCMADRGHDVEATPQGIAFVYSVAGTSGVDDAFDKCSIGTTAVLEPAYVDTQRNPEGVDSNELVLACLQREQLLDESISVEFFVEHNGSTTTGVNGSDSSKSWDLPFDQDDPRYISCLENLR